MAKLLCPGLSRTGSRSLAKALDMLGFRVCHWQPHRLSDVILGQTPNPDFRRYDDVHAILDLPASLFFRELAQTYKSSRVILTVRDEDDWWKSVWDHYLWVHQNLEGQMLKEAIQTQMIAYGTTRPNEYIYKKKFREHNEAVLALFPDALVLNVCAGDGWSKLCPWVGFDAPDRPFPKVRENRKPCTA